jgi:anthranilate synthase component 1
MSGSGSTSTGARTAGSTTAAQFAALVDGHRVIPVIRELFADGETPVGIYRKLAAGKPGTFLLESAEQGGIWSRFSFVGVSSFGVLTQRDDEPSATPPASPRSRRWPTCTNGGRPRGYPSTRR